MSRPTRCRSPSTGRGSWFAAGASETVEGAFRSRVVVIEFADHATALACYRSPEYQAALKLRTGASTADVILIEGYDGPQPG